MWNNPRAMSVRSASYEAIAPIYRRVAESKYQVARIEREPNPGLSLRKPRISLSLNAGYNPGFPIGPTTKKHRRFVPPRPILRRLPRRADEGPRPRRPRVGAPVHREGLL